MEQSPWREGRKRRETDEQEKIYEVQKEGIEIKDGNVTHSKIGQRLRYEVKNLKNRS